MTRRSHRFDPNHVISVYKDEQPELYELAESALLEGDGIFIYHGRLWEVGEGEGLLGDYLNIRPEEEDCIVSLLV